jgi:DNA polymerase-3 subunit chi
MPHALCALIKTMTEILFVETTARRMEVQACEIAERNYLQGDKLQIIAENQEQAKRLDDLLWTFKPDSFVPHGIGTGSADESDQPVVIITEKERLGKINALLMMDYVEAELVSQFSRAVHLIVVDDPERLERSRGYWTELKEAGFTLRHQKQ